jgi:hypothetical protein
VIPNLGMLPGGIRQDEVIETVRQRLAGDTDANLGHVGEVRQALLARRMVLTEDHLALSAVFGIPGADTRRSKVRRSRSQSRSGWRRCISSSTITGRMPGRVTSSGKMSLSHTPLSGSATFRRRGDRPTLLSRGNRIHERDHFTTS